MTLLSSSNDLLGYLVSHYLATKHLQILCLGILVYTQVTYNNRKVLGPTNKKMIKTMKCYTILYIHLAVYKLCTSFLNFL